MTFRYLFLLLKIFLYYLCLFAICRLAFLVYFSSQLSQLGPGIFLQSLYKALPLDVSTASYLLLLPLVLLLFGVFGLNRLFTGAVKFYLLFTSIFCVILSIAEIGVYQEVHVKIYFNLLSHLAHPDELIHSVSYALLIPLLLLITLLIYVVVLVINRLIKQPGYAAQKITPARAVKLFVAFLITAPLLLMGARGGLQPIAINEGEVYFSHNQCVNDATVNPLWNIVHSFIENSNVLHGNAYKVTSDEEANKTVAALFARGNDSTIHIFKTARPNICIIILESWSADLIESLGGYSGLTPNFEKLIKEGYVFTNLKPAGHVSDQGVPAILSGYPALPIGSAINQPAKQVNLPCINNQLQEAGYYSSFFFGGQLIYGNIKSYIYRNGFNRVIEQKDLPANYPAGNLGIHDSIMLSVWLDNMKTAPQPFFTNLFTLSTHSPFDEPAAHPIDWGGLDKPYLNSVVYADRQLGVFFDKVKQQDWYNNTVFILVADHSHSTPKNYDYDTPEFYHIPLLITGGALKEEYRGVKDTALACQTDIASTLLNQLNLNSSAYRWSKNLLNPGTQRFAFYTFNEGFGFVDSTGATVWNKKFPTMSMERGGTDAAKKVRLEKGQAMLQVLMNDFLSR